MTNFSSQEFILKLKNKDHSSIEQLINAYHETLFRAALNQGLGSDQAEEVVQACWITFFDKVSSFEGRSHIRTYIFGILYNKIKELWRSNKKYTHDYDDSALDHLFNENGGFSQSPQDPSAWIENKEIGNIILEELNRLPENQRLAFTLKFIEGEKSQNICNILGVSVTNLGVLIYRAKNMLRIKIEKRLAGSEDE